MKRSSWLRLALASASLSAWMLLLFTGFALGGLVHLLLAATLALFPWKAVATQSDAP